MKERTFNKKEIGLIVQKLRIERGITKKQLAFDLNVDLSFITQLEAGQKGLNLDDLVELSYIFDVNVKDIIFSEGYLKKAEERFNKKKEVLRLCFSLDEEEIDYILEIIYNITVFRDKIKK